MRNWTSFFLMYGIFIAGTGIPLSDFYPFGANEKDFTVGPTLDGNNSTLLDQEFPFFNERYSLIYISNNGIVSFNHSFNGFAPKDFPLRSNRSLIAPFWADSDTQKSGTVWFKIISNDVNLLARACRDIRRYFSSQQKFEPNFLFVSTWERVPHYNSGNKTNTYQCVLVSDGVKSFTFFHYADGMIEWTTGDVTGMNGLGGREAQIGYDAGDGVNYHSIYLSGTPEIINISSTSNVNRSGVWAFRLDLEKDQEEEPEVTDQEEEPTIPDQEEEPTIPDQVEESMVPDYAEGPVVTCCDQISGTHHSGKNINVALISIVITCIVVVLLSSLSTLALGVYCIRKWKKNQLNRSSDNSAHVYEEVGENTEMKIYKKNDMPVNERYGEIGNIDVIMNECVAYAVIKT